VLRSRTCVRELSGAPEALIGVRLMREAFKTDGVLWDPNVDGGESEAMMALFRGAIGVFKNPSSHRAADYGLDPVQASEVVLLADLLLRLLDDASANQRSGRSRQHQLRVPDCRRLDRLATTAARGAGHREAEAVEGRPRVAETPSNS
jgi:uncharacterized protein (TIGR02391 family)